MRLKALLASTVLALSFAVVACGGDDDDDAGDDGATTPTATSQDSTNDSEDSDDSDDSDGEGGVGGGTATLTVGDQTWNFDGVLCALSTEDSGTDTSPFNLTAFGESDSGNRTQLYADIYDSQEAGRTEGEGVSYNVSLADIEDFANPSIHWQTNNEEFMGGSMPTFELDGKNLSVEGVFDDVLTENEAETVPGSLEATCP
jgi:hypothetical protein